jgi:uncharacterized protein YdaT
MKNLPKEAREKAVEIANELLKDKKMDEGIAIATSINSAKDWAANRGKPFESARSGRSTDVKAHGHDKYVVPASEGWAIKDEGSRRRQKLFDTKREAVAEARREAREHRDSLTIQKRDGKVEKRVSYNPKRSGPKQ